MTGLEFAEVEQIIDQLEQMVSGFIQRLGVVAGALVQVSVEQKPGQADDAIERGAKFVAYDRQKLGLAAIARLGRIARKINSAVSFSCLRTSSRKCSFDAVNSARAPRSPSRAPSIP